MFHAEGSVNKYMNVGPNTNFLEVLIYVRLMSLLLFFSNYSSRSSEVKLNALEFIRSGSRNDKFSVILVLIFSGLRSKYLNKNVGLLNACMSNTIFDLHCVQCVMTQAMKWRIFCFLKE